MTASTARVKKKTRKQTMRRDRFDQLLADWRWDDKALVALAVLYVGGWMMGWW